MRYKERRSIELKASKVSVQYGGALFFGLHLWRSDEQVLVGSSPKLYDLLTLVVQSPFTGISPLTAQTSMLNCFLVTATGTGTGTGAGGGCSFFTTGFGVGLTLATWFTGGFEAFAAFGGAGVGVATTRGLVRESAANLFVAFTLGLGVGPFAGADCVCREAGVGQGVGPTVPLEYLSEGCCADGFDVADRDPVCGVCAAPACCGFVSGACQGVCRGIAVEGVPLEVVVVPLCCAVCAFTGTGTGAGVDGLVETAAIIASPARRKIERLSGVGVGWLSETFPFASGAVGIIRSAGFCP